jgi:hypothetical protein
VGGLGRREEGAEAVATIMKVLVTVSGLTVALGLVGAFWLIGEVLVDIWR